MSSDDGSLVLFRRVRDRLDRQSLREFAAALRDFVAAGRPFCCLLAHDSHLLRLNRRFLGRDYPADVLAFPSHVPDPPPAPLGDVAISVDRAREQAARLGHSTEDEIRILMLHGVLHLLGLDHETDGGRMRRIERRWRRQFRLPARRIPRRRR